jgi:outer membrane lipoprotein SlyB
MDKTLRGRADSREGLPGDVRLQRKLLGQEHLRQAFSHTALGLVVISLLAGCVATGQQYQANVYKAGQVNQVQEAKTVEILAVLPAKIEVDNTEGKKQAMVVGALLGAVGGAAIGHAIDHSDTLVGAAGGTAAGAAMGSLAADQVLVDGVQLTYVEGGKTLSSAQVGKLCEFKPGTAIVISTGPNETRVQPNNICPPEAARAR